MREPANSAKVTVVPELPPKTSTDFVVKVHTCYSFGKAIPRDSLVSGRLYVECPNTEATSFFELKARCSCRLTVSIFESNDYWEDGVAVKIYKVKRGRLFEVKNMIWMPIDRGRTPRIDMITSADIERAYVDKLDKYVEYIEEVHKLYLDFRAELVVEYSEQDFWARDAFDGRAIFAKHWSEGPRPSVGRDVEPAEMELINAKLSQ